MNGGTKTAEQGNTSQKNSPVWRFTGAWRVSCMGPDREPHALSRRTAGRPLLAWEGYFGGGQPLPGRFGWGPARRAPLKHISLGADTLAMPVQTHGSLQKYGFDRGPRLSPCRYAAWPGCCNAAGVAVKLWWCFVARRPPCRARVKRHNLWRLAVGATRWAIFCALRHARPAVPLTPIYRVNIEYRWLTHSGVALCTRRVPFYHKY